MGKYTHADLELECHNSYLPLRREVRSVVHFLHPLGKELRTGLGVGFANPSVSRALAQLGGYWMSVETSHLAYEHVVTNLGGERVLRLGAQGSMPFEDKQFDAVALGYGLLQDTPSARQIIEECHRILKTGGLLVFTVDYRKRWSLANALGRGMDRTSLGIRCTEAEIFKLLKDGFDVLGLRFASRFFVQLLRQWLGYKINAQNTRWSVRAFYGMANVLDLFLFWTRGHQMTVCGRRKGWRGQKTKLLGDHIPVSDAVLSNPMNESKRFDLQKLS